MAEPITSFLFEIHPKDWVMPDGPDYHELQIRVRFCGADLGWRRIIMDQPSWQSQVGYFTSLAVKEFTQLMELKEAERGES